MDGIKYAVFTEKSLRLLGKNQYTFNVESGFTKTEIKHWVELFFGVKVVAVNSHRLPGKGRRIGPILGHTMHYRRMIITLQPGYSIPLLDREKHSRRMNETRHSLEVRPFYRTLFQFQKRGRLKLLTGVIVSQQVTRTVCKKRSIFFLQNIFQTKNKKYNTIVNIPYNRYT